MQGTVIGFDQNSHSGALTGHDGKRYEFIRLEWRDSAQPAQGTEVEFVPEGNTAKNIFILKRPAAPFSWSSFLLSTEGRISRSEYWLKFVLPYFVVSIVLSIIDAFVFGSTETGIGVLSLLFALIALWPSIAVGVKRCHDRDRTGWFLLIAFIPIIGAIWLLVEIGFLRGTVGANRFGGDPTQRSA